MRKFKWLLPLLALLICSWTSPYIDSSEVRFSSILDINRKTPVPTGTVLDDFNEAWHGIYLNQAYIKPFLGECDSKHISNCVQYTYLAAYKAFGDKMDYRDVLSITYWGELAIFGHSSKKLKMASYEAFFRNFFDKQGGGCRFNHDDSYPVFDCRYDNLIAWLSTSQHWRDAAVRSQDGEYIRVNLYRLFGLPYDDISKKTLRGFLGFDKEPFDLMFKNITTWRNGQGSDVPSTWGNTKIAAGATTYTHEKPSEDKGHIIVHYYTDRKATLGLDMPEIPSCTLVSIITTVDGRIPGLGTCS